MGLARELWTLLLSPTSWTLSLIIMMAELVLNTLIVWRVPYTEIDWKAYMSEVEGVVNGTYDYSKLEGGTGPLVYPAGFVYIYTALYYATGHGALIFRAQCIFVALYLVNLALVHRLYLRCGLPPYVLILPSLISYRIHSIFVLRLFNDPVALLLAYAALNLFIDRRWTLGCTLFSLGVSVKMNVLLFAPGLLLALLSALGLGRTVAQLAWCGILQVLLAVPFLYANPLAYIARSFDLGRQFFYIWSVNWKCIPEWVFLHRAFQFTLLLAHVILLLLFALRRWAPGGFTKMSQWQPAKQQWTPRHLISVLFTANFVGVVFARTLHYQFYSWYFYSLAFLVWQTSLPMIARVAILLGVEYSFNIFPATFVSSSVLHACHLVLLAALWVSPVTAAVPTPSPVRVSSRQRGRKKAE